jgi:uncharacterized protein (DUF305 family)
MALHEVAHGRNKEMVQPAKSIIAEQQIENKIMKQLLTSAYHTPRNEIKTEYMQRMNTMMKDMPATNELRNMDAAFPKANDAPQPAALDMAKVLLKHGNDKALRRMAESIISNERNELNK